MTWLILLVLSIGYGIVLFGGFAVGHWWAKNKEKPYTLEDAMELFDKYNASQR